MLYMIKDPADELRAAGAARETSLARYRTAHARLAALVMDARAAGVPIVDIANLSGVSRPTIYKIISNRGG